MGPCAVEPRRKDSERIFDWMDIEGWRPCWGRVDPSDWITSCGSVGSTSASAGASPSFSAGSGSSATPSAFSAVGAVSASSSGLSVFFFAATFLLLPSLRFCFFNCSTCTERKVSARKFDGKVQSAVHKILQIGYTYRASSPPQASPPSLPFLYLLLLSWYGEELYNPMLATRSAQGFNAKTESYCT